MNWERGSLSLRMLGTRARLPPQRVVLLGHRGNTHSGFARELAMPRNTAAVASESLASVEWGTLASAAAATTSR